MIFGIICAMEEELAAIVKVLKLQKPKSTIKASSKYLEFSYQTHKLVLVTSGIGKVNAAIATQILIDFYSVELILNIGVAGSLTKELTFGDVVIASDLVEHDFDITSFGVVKGQIARMDTFSFPTAKKYVTKLANLTIPKHRVMVGRIITGDQFIDDGNKALELQTEFNALACEMEGAAIAHGCYLNNLPVIVVRSLSDMAGQDEQGIHSFNQLKEMAADNAALIISKFLESI